MTWTTPRTWVAGELVTADIMNSAIRDQFNVIGGAWSPYTLQWTASTTNPVLGTNGSYSARYRKVGRTVDLNVFVNIGSDTTKGEGAYSINLPATPAVGRFVIAGMVFDNGATVNLSPIYMVDNTGALFSGSKTTPPDFSAMTAADFTFASGSWIALSGTYESI